MNVVPKDIYQKRGVDSSIGAKNNRVYATYYVKKYL